MQPNDLLIADLNHFGESLWRNEEVGEKRFNFFITLVTAVIAALVALYTTNNHIAFEVLKGIESGVLWVLLVFGFLTYLRMVQRNHVTDEYQRTLTYIREHFISLCPELKSYKVPRTHKTRWSKWLKGGYAETIGILNSVFLGALMFRVYNIDIYTVLPISLVFFILQWLRANKRKKGDK